MLARDFTVRGREGRTDKKLGEMERHSEGAAEIIVSDPWKKPGKKFLVQGAS